PFVICTHGWLAVAVHALAAPVNVTVTACPAVTAVKALVAPGLVAENRKAAGLAATGPDTVSVAAALVAVPTLLVATARYWFPVKLADVPVIVNVAVVAPLYGAALLTFVNVEPPLVDTCHWYVGAGAPLAATVNVAFAPAVTV